MWLYRPRRHITDRHDEDRVVAISPQAQAVLFRYLARDTHTPCFRPYDSEAKRRGIAGLAAKQQYSALYAEKHIEASPRVALNIG